MVRAASFEDVARMSEIMVISFRTAFASFVSPETMDRCTVPENCRRMLEELYHSGAMDFFYDDRGGMLIRQRGERETEILALHTLPECRGKGVGQALLHAALEGLEGTVFLWAFRDNARARRFYEKNGFRPEGSERFSEFDGAVEVKYVREAVHEAL